MKRLLLLLLFSVNGMNAGSYNIYTLYSSAGLTPGLSYVTNGDGFEFEFGGNYALGSEMTNLRYDGYAVNMLLTYRTDVKKNQFMIFKAGPAFREFTTTYSTLNYEIKDVERKYFNYGFDYVYIFKDKQEIGFSYMEDSYGVVFRTKF